MMNNMCQVRLSTKCNINKISKHLYNDDDDDIDDDGGGGGNIITINNITKRIRP